MSPSFANYSILNYKTLPDTNWLLDKISATLWSISIERLLFSIIDCWRSFNALFVNSWKSLLLREFAIKQSNNMKNTNITKLCAVWDVINVIGRQIILRIKIPNDKLYNIVGPQSLYLRSTAYFNFIWKQDLYGYAMLANIKVALPFCV